MKKMKRLTALMLATFLSAPGAMAAEALTPEQKSEVEKLVGSYLREHPEAVIEAIQVWQLKQKLAEQAQREQTIAELREEIKGTGSPTWGKADGKTVIVEFSDYNCPYCKKVFPGVKELVEEDGDIRIVMKELPVLGPNSEYAAKAALAAKLQGKYQEFHFGMMEAGSRPSPQTVDELAKRIGMDMERMKKDMQAPQVKSELEANQLWAERLGINGTPAFVIGEQVIPGAIDKQSMQRIVELTRREKKE